MSKFIKALILYLLTSIFVSTIWSAPNDNDLPIINSIKIHFNKFQNASEEAVFAHIKIHEGHPYDQIGVSESIRSLYATSLYQLIRIQAEPLPDNKLNITFVLDPKPRITSIGIQGNKQITARKLLKQTKSKVGGPLDESILNCDILAIKEYYNKRGFTNAEVCYEFNTDESIGKATVCFKINEGRKTRITKITFCGHEPCKESALRGLMQTKKWNILSFFSGKGRFKEEAFNEDIESLRNFFRNQGYLDVEIDDSDIEIVQTASTVSISINIRKGTQYKVGNVSIANNKLFSSEKLCPLIKLKEGDVFSPLLIEESELALREAYGQLGYLDTYAVAERKPNIQTGAIDLEFVIHESGKAFVESIKIQGNTKTKSNVIIRELALAPGDVFDLIRMQSSEKRLQNTRFFENVSLLPEETNIPGRRNLLVAVKEGGTGNLLFSISFSSIERFVGQVEISQSNFDITNYRHGFQGAGQKFRIKGRYGSKTNEVEITFEEPWVCERELTFGVNLFRVTAKYFEDYDELKAGLNIYFRKRLWGLIEGQLAYGLQETKIYNIDKDAAEQIHEAKGKHTASKIALGLSYDTRDEIVYPNQGTYVLLNSEVAGGILQAQTKYVKLEATGAQWIPIFDCAKQVFLIGGSTGTIMPYGNQKIFFFDKFFLGGPESLRGFGFQQVGPKAPSKRKKGKHKHSKHKHFDPIGGDTFARFTLEYSVKILDNVRFVTFYDWGFVNSAALDWSPGSYNDNWGVGLRIFILNAPLRLDWGFPIKGDGINDKKDYVFNFSFGTTF